MASSLIPRVQEVLAGAAAAPDGQAILREYDQVVQFTALDGPSFYIEVKDGAASVHEGAARPRPMMEAHEYKGTEAVFEAFLTGQVRMSDAIHDGKLFPIAAHTTKRHIDHWIAKLVRVGLGQPSLRDVY